MKTHRLTHPTALVGLAALAATGVIGLGTIRTSTDPQPVTSNPIVATHAADPTTPSTTIPTTSGRPAYLIIQDEIDRALAERDAGG